MDAKKIASNIQFRGIIEAPDTECELEAISVDYDGKPLAIWMARDHEDALYARDVAENGVSFPLSTPPEETPIILTTHHIDGSCEQKLSLAHAPVTYPMIQRLPNDRFLLVGARAVYDPELGPEHNAFVISSTGEVITTGCLGDGLEDVQTDREGNIWTTYFDEGVGGNLGWGESYGDEYIEPIGAKCLIKWDSNLNELWHIPDVESLIKIYGEEQAGKYWVSEIYTLNVSDKAVNFSSYPFDAWLSVRDDQLFLYPVHEDLKYGGFYLATHDETACFFGNFSDGSEWIIANCKDGGWEELLRCQQAIPSVNNAKIWFIAQRESRLHFFLDDRSWHTFDLADFLSS